MANGKKKLIRFLKMLPLRQFVRQQNYLQYRHFSTKTKRTTRTEKVALYGQDFPDKLLNTKHKTPAHMYLANKEIANEISEYIVPYLEESKCNTIVEVNPGLAYFTRQLLLARETQFRKIILMESMEHFMPQLHELQLQDPKRLVVRHGDFFNLWKLVFQDKQDNGGRVAALLNDMPQQDYEAEPSMLLFGAVGAYVFFKHLINSLVFQHGMHLLGRLEMILAIPPPIYIHLTCSNEIGYLIYRSTSVLFQILFEHRFIAKVPREQFLPPQSEYNITKSSKLGKVKSINPEYLYLVKIVPRHNVFDLCPPGDLPALWYFVKQNFISRRNRIIPNLEKWIPGCGPRLIINTQPTEHIKPLFKNVKSQKLPQYSTRCSTMSTRDYFPGINIYTQFGDLSPSQVLSLFTQFRNWPEYPESSFIASLENTLLKLETAADESIDGENIAEEDDITPENAALGGVDEEAIPTEKPTKRRKSIKSEISDNK